jgi:hypothetical protein
MTGKLDKSALFLLLAALNVGAGSCATLRRQPTNTGAGAPPPPIFTSADGAPTSFVASNSDAKTTRIVMLRDGFTRPTAFRAASDFLSEKYTIDVSDPNAGYLMTPWQAALSRNGAPELRYRTRIILRFLGDEWKQLAVRAEANWLRGDEWQVGYDAALLDSVTVELGARLGRR